MDIIQEFLTDTGLTEDEFNLIFQLDPLVLIEESKLKDWMKGLANTSKEKIKLFVDKRVQEVKKREAYSKKHLESNGISVNKIKSSILPIINKHKSSLISKLRSKDINGLKSETIDISKEISKAMRSILVFEDPKQIPKQILKSLMIIILLGFINSVVLGFLIGLLTPFGVPVWVASLVAFGLIIPFIEELFKRVSMRKGRMGEFFIVFNLFEFQCFYSGLNFHFPFVRFKVSFLSSA